MFAVIIGHVYDSIFPSFFEEIQVGLNTLFFKEGVIFDNSEGWFSNFHLYKGLISVSDSEGALSGRLSCINLLDPEYIG